MRYATTYSRSLRGIQALETTIEVHVSPGLPGITVVGLAEASVKESKDRVRSALINSGFEFPQARVTINLAPAELPKDGASLDLPIAVGILAATGQLELTDLNTFEFMGELALSGELREVRGSLAAAFATAQNHKKLVLPKASAAQAALVEAASVVEAATLKDVVSMLSGAAKLKFAQPQTHSEQPSYPDLKDVLGQQAARRALEVCAAGRHSMLMTGPPGVGKTMLASRLPGLLPELNNQEALEVLRVYSVANESVGFGVRPFRAPHHSASAAALIGGGSRPKPGEVSCAHFGVLFLDELPEFDRKVLEVMRQPLESKVVHISRVNSNAEFPANFQLVAAMNPCPCGYLADPSGRCNCTPDQVKRYTAKVSGPLMDRIDLQVRLSKPAQSELHVGESSSEVRQRVARAWQIQRARQGVLNSELTPQKLMEVALLGPAEQALLNKAAERMFLSLRAQHRVLKISRSIADLAGSEQISAAHLAEALSYRALS